MRRLLLIIPAILLLPLLALGAVLLWANTEPGRETLARLASSHVPGLTMEGLEGPLPGRMRLGRFAMADREGVWIEGEDVVLDLALRDFVSRTLRVEALTAGRLTVHRPPLPDPDAPPPPPPDPDAGLLPQLPSLPVAVRLDRLSVAKLELGEPLMGQAAAFGLEGSASLDGNGLQARLAADRQDREGRLALDLGLAPGADRLTANISLKEPPGGLVATMARKPELPADITLTLDGPASGAKLDLQAALGPELGATLSGTVRAAPDGAAGAVLAGQIRPGAMLPPDLAPLAGPLEVSLDADLSAQKLLTLRPLTVAAPAGQVRAEGSVDLGASQALALKLDLRVEESGRFAALLPPDLAAWQAIRLAGEVTGTIPAPAVALEASAEGFSSSQQALGAALGPTPRITLRGAMPDRLETFTLEGAAAHAEASGNFGDPLDLAFSLAAGELSGLAPGVEGGLKLEGRATGPRTDPSLDVTAQADRLAAAGRVLQALNLTAHIRTPVSAPSADVQADGRLEGLPLALRLRGSPEGEWLRLEQAEASLGLARLDASGRVNAGAALFDGQARLEASDLAPLGRLAGGPLAGRLRLALEAAPRDGVQGFDARLDVPAFSGFGVTGAGGTLRAQGTVKDAEIALNGRASGIEAETRARIAAEDDGAWRIDLAALRASQGQDSIRLTEPARVMVRPGGAVETPGLNLALPRGGSLRAGGRWGPEQADMRLNLAGLPLAIVRQFAPAAPAMEGVITGEATVTGKVSAPAVRANLRGTGLRVTEPWARGLPAAEIRADINGSMAGATEARVEAVAGQGTRLVATANLPRGPGGGPDAPLQAALDGTVDIGRLTGPLLAAGADRATGRLNLALRADGRLGQPRLGGTATLSGGEYRNLAQGVRLRDIEGRIRAEGTQIILERLEARTRGEGSIAVRGTLDPLAPGMPVDVTVNANQAQPIANEMVRGVFDAALTLTGALQTGARLAGPIRIRRLEITVPEKLPGTIRTLDQVTERGRPPNGNGAATRTTAAAPAPGNARRGAAAKGRAPAGNNATTGSNATAAPTSSAPAGGPPPIALALQVQAPRAVFIRGRGLDAEMGGEIGVGGTVAAPELSGTFAMRRGTLAVLTKDLEFSRGALRWDGTLLPQLDFLATSRSSNVTVQVAVEGPPTEPRISFSSTPELPQDEVLARLLFDRSARELSPFEIAQLAQAVAGATGVGGGGGGFMDRIRRTLGLDRLAVGSSNEAVQRESSNGESGRSGTGAPTLEAGRYVADGVYVGVQQGTEAGTARAGVRVDITPRLKLEAQTGDREAGERLGFSWEYEW